MGIEFQTSTLLSKIDKLFSTSRTIVKEAILHAQFPSLIYSLDTLLTDQIQTCDYLHKLEVDRNQERPKQVAQAKNILHQKKKSLSELFKTLSTIGINYKTGLMEKTLGIEVTDMKITPFCLKTMLINSGHRKLDQNLIYLNENNDLYYYKAVFKLKLLFNVFLTPDPAIGPQDIERMKGFSIDLFLLVQNQRKLLGQFVRDLFELKSCMKQAVELKECLNNSDDSLDFVNLLTRKEKIINGVVAILSIFEQFKLVLKTIPNENHNTYSLIIKNTGMSLQSENIRNLLDKSNKILHETKEILNDINKKSSIFVSEYLLKNYEKRFNTVVESIKIITNNFVDSHNQYLPIISSLVDLVNSLEKSVDYKISESVNYDNYNSDFDNIIHSVLISMQNIYKKYSVAKEDFYKEQNGETNSNEVADLDDDKESHIENILESHLKLKISREIKNDIETLNLARINAKLEYILNEIKNSCNQTYVKRNFVYKLVGLVPILEQFYHLGEYYLVQQLGAHKVSSKMLSILLTVFIELGSKGFCVPPDLMQDEEGDKKQKDDGKGEGFGLEDGQGENDVSDRIESEDQLDDAKRPNDEKKNDNEEEGDCKEEKGIEMSDDFDAKMQDVDKKDNKDSDSDKSDNEEELDKQMGETEENAETLDEQIWGDDEKEDEEDADESKELNEEENGKGSDELSDKHDKMDSQKEESDQNGKEQEGLDAAQDDSKNKQKENKEINEMPDDPEMDDEQINPHHNDLEDPPEADEMNLDDNINMDNDEPADQNDADGDENPFDIDQMKDQMEVEETGAEDGDDDKHNDQSNEEEKNDENDSDFENPEFGNQEKEKDENEILENEENDIQTPGEVDENKDEGNEDDNKNEEEDDKKIQTEDFHESKDKPSKIENIQSMPETKNQSSSDQVEMQHEKNQKADDPMDEQDTGEEKDGVGQADNEESKTGHKGITDRKEQQTKEEVDQNKNKKEEKKQGSSNDDRTLSDMKNEKNKRLKTIDMMNEKENNDQTNGDSENDDDDVDDYQHIKDPKQTDKTTMDAASEEQSKQIQHKDDIEKNETENDENPDELMETEEINEPEQNQDKIDSIKTEETSKESSKKNKNEKTKEKCDVKEEIVIEGEKIATHTVPRSSETTSHTSSDIIMDMSTPVEPTTIETLELRRLYEKEVLSNRLIHPDPQNFDAWQQISNKMLPNARELCEQLRLILEPTKATRLKGDYRTGRRINMRKIIPYIASQFRKDKIWLRRTKAAQRDYKITIAIDDSKSMDHNQSKTLTLEAISLVSQALTLLESGKLNIISFGETPQIILNYHEQFDGPKLVKALNFDQNQSRIAELLDFTRISNCEDSNRGGGNLFENLLLVISDGRNIFSEGEQKVKNSVKLARLQRIFIVYVIIDNPENKHSILDIRVPIFSKDTNQMTIKSYLDTFPFPYYIIVRELGQLPLVLSDAMRQWFELVNSEQ